MLLKGGRGYGSVVEIHCTGLVYEAGKDCVHEPLKGHWRVAKTKGGRLSQSAD